MFSLQMLSERREDEGDDWEDVGELGETGRETVRFLLHVSSCPEICGW